MFGEFVMSSQGGIATLNGIRYEIKVVLYEIPRLLRGEIKTLRYQPLSSALEPSQTPKTIFTDDMSFLDGTGQNYYCQAKHNTKDADWTILRLINEGVLEQFLRQYRNTPECRLRLTSNLPAQPLNGLAEYARQAISTKEFTSNWTQQIEKDCKCISENLKADCGELWEMLKKVECIHLTNDTADRYIWDYACQQYQAPEKFISVIKDLIENNPSAIINYEKIQKKLEDNGLYHMSVISEKDILNEFQKASGTLRLYRSNIQGVHLERPETNHLFEWIKTTSESNQVAFLIDIAGSGKSVIMKDLLERLEKEGMPVLAIKADTLSSITNEDQLKSALNISDSPEAMLSLTGKDKTAVMLVDQLDALSQTFARSQDCLDLMIRLIGRVARIRNVRIVVSCRDFDRKFDPKLRQVTGQEFTIKPLDRPQIEEVLTKIKIKYEKLTSKELELLKNPQHLLSYTEVVSEKILRNEAIESFATIQDLYHELWNLKVAHARNCPVDTSELQDTIYALVDNINATQQIHQPISVLDSYSNAVRYLQSAGILTAEGYKVGFFHQSFFDYCYARRFVSKHTSLAETIYSSDQGLFVRPQMVQTLTHLRGTDERLYLKELNTLMDYSDSKKIRYHLTELLYSWFGQQRNLTMAEKEIGLQCIQTNTRLIIFLSGAKDNAEWFGIVQSNLNNLFQLADKEINQVIAFLISVMNEKGEEVFNALKPKIGSSSQWDDRIEWCLSQYKKWDSDTAANVLIEFCSNNPNPGDRINGIIYHLVDTNIELACKVSGIILERSFEKWSKETMPSTDTTSILETGSNANNLSKAVKESFDFDKYARKLMPFEWHWVEKLVIKASKDCPKLYIEIILPWLIKVLPKLVKDTDKDGWQRDAVFIWAFSSARSGEPSNYIIDGLKKSLENVADQDQPVFLSHSEEISQTSHLVLHQVLARVLISRSNRYALWALGYLLTDPIRFDIPEELSGGNISRKLVAAIFPHLDAVQRGKLERAILEYYPSWEKEPDCKEYYGVGQLDLLFGVPDDLLSEKGRGRKQELQGKFPNRKPSKPTRPRSGMVRSPIPNDQCGIMSDEDWIKAMKKYDDSTGWGSPREDFLKGGVVELSRTFQVVVKEKPSLISLIERFDGSISSSYLSALIEGLGESSIEPHNLFDACRKVIHLRRSDSEIQRSMCRILEKRAKQEIPNDLIEYIREAALTSPDPEREMWQEEASGGSKYYGGNPLDYGINTVRGHAVISYAICMSQNTKCNMEQLLSTLEEMAKDKSSAVRACLIHVLPNILHFDRSRIVKIFESAIKNRVELLKHNVSHDFIYYALYSHTHTMLKYIRIMAESENDKDCESAGQLAALALFENKDARGILRSWINDKKVLLKVTSKVCSMLLYFKIPQVKTVFQDYMKRSRAFTKGAGSVFARNVDNPKLQDVCLAYLRQLCKIENNEVTDAIGWAFEHLPSPDCKKIVSFINKFVTKRFSGMSGEKVLKYCITHCQRYPEFALQIGEKILHRFTMDKDKPNDFYWSVDDDLINLILAVYNSNTNDSIRRRAMDLFDEAMESGSYQARNLLSSLDR